MFLNSKYAQIKFCMSNLGSRPLNKFKMIQKKVINKKEQEEFEIQEKQKNQPEN